MKEKETSKLYNSITNVDNQFIEKAQAKLKKKKNGWLKWGAMVACLCLVIGGIFFFNRSNEANVDNRLAIETIDNIEQISSLYEGTLLVENLVLSDSEAATIKLSHLENKDIHDTSNWDTLSVTADYPDYSLVLNCSFQRQIENDYSSEVFDTLQYGNVLVNLYQKEPTPESEYVYGALFEYDGVFYQLLSRSNDPDCIYNLLDTVISANNSTNTNEPTEHTFTDILGFDGYYVRVEESTPNFYIWYYYTEIDGKTQCIAETFGPLGTDYDPEAYSVDLDNDGIMELVCNCMYNDGVERVIIYRSNNGVIENGFIKERDLEADFNIDVSVAALAIIVKYDPVENIFNVINYAQDGSVRTAVVNMDYFEFLPYVPTGD